MRFPLIALAVLTVLRPLLPSPASAHPDPVASEMQKAASQFLDALAAPDRARAQLSFNDAERTHWNFIPMERRGLPLKSMTPAQRTLALALLHTALSQSGSLKASLIMSLENVLRDQGDGTGRDPELYYFTIFGDPRGSGPWGWRVEGHHLSVNLTLDPAGAIAETPSFFGANPAQIQEGERQGLRTLPEAEDLGRQLVKALDADQQKTAIINTTAPREIITGASRRVTPGKPAGLAYAQMQPPQQAVLTRLMLEYLGRYRPELAHEDWAKIEKAGLDKVCFAWAGGLEPGQGHYYRIQGPSFLMEYDNTQNHANHVHTVWRDFEHDFGYDVLRQHYQDTPHPE